MQYRVKQFLLDWAAPETTNAGTKWYPHEWIGQLLLIWTTESTIQDRWRWVLGGIGGSVASIAVAILVAQLIYQRGWENIRLLKAKRKSIRHNGDSKASSLKGITVALGRGPIKAMMVKDFLIYVRHSGRLIAILMLTLFLALHIGGPIYTQRWDERCRKSYRTNCTLQPSNYFSVLVCNGFRDEGKTWWMLKSAPVTPRLGIYRKIPDCPPLCVGLC